MRSQSQKPKGKDGFPESPIAATDLLIPITSWDGMVCESRITGAELDSFWHERVVDGVCYLYRWLGKPRATVWVIYDDDALRFIECRTLRGRLVPRAEAEPIICEVVKRYRAAGFWRLPPVVDETKYPPPEDDICIECDRCLALPGAAAASTRFGHVASCASMGRKVKI